MASSFLVGEGGGHGALALAKLLTSSFPLNVTSGGDFLEYFFLQLRFLAEVLPQTPKRLRKRVRRILLVGRQKRAARFRSSALPTVSAVKQLESASINSESIRAAEKESAAGVPKGSRRGRSPRSVFTNVENANGVARTRRGAVGREQREEAGHLSTSQVDGDPNKHAPV
ncbi:hypothetical protein MTO96_007508 [Rhipicephalus appendiculatus]